MRTLRAGWKDFTKKLNNMSRYLGKKGLNVAVISVRKQTCFVIKMSGRVLTTLLSPVSFPARLVMDASRYGLNAKGVWNVYRELALRTGNQTLYSGVSSFARREDQYSKTLFKDGYKKYLKDCLRDFNPLRPL
jgi:hypothetical protein